MYKKLLEKLNQEEFKIFRPMPSPIDKIQNRYRWDVYKRQASGYAFFNFKTISLANFLFISIILSCKKQNYSYCFNTYIINFYIK